ncbi:hypothetical protein R8124_000617 [Salmonella enterica]|uniref:Uncharacterized protein n=2 Tax=Salmonella enterica TaxID=28901 RepID=A0A6Y5L012_SALET|nr:hypothetical protein [Salmonella enterica]HAB1649539.1 hypothetical protein [Salmonella enterica subsp. enterica]EBY8685127.1 hypothetical protein [Salmonella enterica subsp. enterica serovar Agona]EHW1978119.1 hypothetical protein [Salmonella enterica subsp. enterica serovar Agona]EKG5011710.1 hypothetical protein [Salmonella enterica]EKG5048388.1 hypothetical protein [Salmonella enterica]
MTEPTNEVNAADFDRLARALDAVAMASTKKMAEPDLLLINSLAAGMKRNLDGYVAEQLEAAINQAKEASGKIKDKQRYYDHFRTYLYKFENGITLV